MIRLKTLIPEQTVSPTVASTTQVNVPKPLDPRSYEASSQRYAAIARKIYNSKGIVADDANGAVSVIKNNIQNLNDYKEVTKSLKQMNGNRGIGEYLHSFMNIVDRDRSLFKIASHLMKVIPENHWNWTVKKIITPTDLLDFMKADYDAKYGVEAPYQKSQMDPKKYLQQFWQNMNATHPLYKYFKEVYPGYVLSDLFIKNFVERATPFVDKYKHEILSAASIGAYFIPGIGFFASTILSAGISLVNAGIYLSEDDLYNAGVETVFALIPAIGGKVSQLPAVKRLGAKMMANLGAKLARASVKAPILSNIEKQAIGEILQYQNVLRQDFNQWARARAIAATKAASKRANSKPFRVLEKFANGSLKLTGTAAKYQALNIPYEIGKDTWDRAYIDLGIEQVDWRNIDKQFDQEKEINTKIQSKVPTAIQAAAKSKAIATNTKSQR